MENEPSGSGEKPPVSSQDVAQPAASQANQNVGTASCPGCGGPMPSDRPYCAKCGQQLKSSTPPSKPYVQFNQSVPQKPKESVALLTIIVLFMIVSLFLFSIYGLLGTVLALILYIVLSKDRGRAAMRLVKALGFALLCIAILFGSCFGLIFSMTGFR